jgi:hypothetical protein
VEEMIKDISSGVDSEVAKKFWNVIDKTFEAYGSIKDAKVNLELVKHFSHRNEGKNYDSNCEVCKS